MGNHGNYKRTPVKDRFMGMVTVRATKAAR